MRVIVSLAILLLFTVNVSAQIMGDVKDQKENGIPNALIIATDSVRNVIDTVKTDSRGFYQFKGLTPGNYVVEAKAAGYRSAIHKNILITSNDTGVVDGEPDLYHGKIVDITLMPAKVPK